MSPLGLGRITVLRFSTVFRNPDDMIFKYHQKHTLLLLLNWHRHALLTWCLVVDNTQHKRSVSHDISNWQNRQWAKSRKMASSGALVKKKYASAPVWEYFQFRSNDTSKPKQDSCGKRTSWVIADRSYFIWSYSAIRQYAILTNGVAQTSIHNSKYIIH